MSKRMSSRGSESKEPKSGSREDKGPTSPARSSPRSSPCTGTSTPTEESSDRIAGHSIYTIPGLEADESSSDDERSTPRDTHPRVGGLRLVSQRATFQQLSGTSGGSSHHEGAHQSGDSSDKDLSKEQSSIVTHPELLPQRGSSSQPDISLSGPSDKEDEDTNIKPR